MTGPQVLFSVFQAVVSGMLALIAGLVVGFVVLRQTGFVPPKVQIGPLWLGGDWPPVVFAVALSIFAMISSFQSYRRKLLSKTSNGKA